MFQRKNRQSTAQIEDESIESDERSADGSDGAGMVAGGASAAMLSAEDDVAATQDLEMVRLSFRITEELHRRLKLEACRRGRTVKATIEGWVREMTPAA